ncbi:hypothetical protein LCGC14_1387290 [marine sediment metagenome]|uniref:Uncharacterized protein n=1 Tax=marine sediment metagenome TaxID=412755 RepID=A0A0F9K113_9ZZZZ
MPKQAVDNMLDGLRAEWEAKQGQYILDNGRYFQGIWTHDIIPTVGAEAPPDKTKKPTDQPHDWNDFGLALPGNMPGSIALHVYEGPNGHGYSLEARTREGGKHWHRVEAYGSDAHDFTHGWRVTTGL